MVHKVTWDKSCDAAYIYLVPIPAGGSKSNLVAEPWIILDFDENRKLLGIEVLNASDRLPAELLEKAEIIG
jgi:uncharacterized protein YuzE